MGQPTNCHVTTIRDKRSPYDQYFFGEKNESDQRNGFGENHWTGPESLEWYTGNFLQDTMHGDGDYRWRFKDPDGAFVTYEGRFYANKLHGYGVMSYANGKVFTGLYYNNVRWGPGIEQMPALKSNVGVWRGTQLARLSWAPLPRSVAPDLSTGPAGPVFLNPFRTILTEHVKTIGEINNAMNDLKEAGADPVRANEIWPKMYPLTCNDPDSALFHKDLFDFKYYKGTKYVLEERISNTTPDFESKVNYIAEYFAWNNNEMMLHMMKHAFLHDKQRSKVKLSLRSILNGPRKRFRPAAKHEMDCRVVLMASYLGHVINVAQLVNEEDVYADIADIRGNTALMYAVCGDSRKIVQFLVDAGANVNSCNDSCCTPLGVALLRYIGVANDIGAGRLVQTLLPPVEKDMSKGPPTGKIDKDAPLVQPIVAMEWSITRELSTDRAPATATQKMKKPSLKNLHTGGSSRSSLHRKRSDSIVRSRELELTFESDDDIFSEDKKILATMKGQYMKRVTELYQPVPGNPEIQYLFAVNDFYKMADPIAHNHKSTMLLRDHSRAMKDQQKSQILWENHAQDISSLDSAEKLKHDMLTQIQLTIFDLLALGADPKLVICPQPAVLLALKTRNPDMVKHMVSYGADINEKFPDLLNYTVLDIVITDEEISAENLAMMQTLLQIGADTQHRLPLPVEPSATLSLVLSSSLEPEMKGPTLLHVVLMKTIEFEDQEDIIVRMMQLLLHYHCDSTAQYLGSSAIHTAMTEKFHLLHVFIKSPCTNLNAIINSKNQTILIKLFSKEFVRETTHADLIPTLTNLLLYGADPLIECYNDAEVYGNIFEFAWKTYEDMIQKNAGRQQQQQEPHVKQPEKKDEKLKKKSVTTNVKEKSNKGLEAEAMEYKELLDLMTECARLLHVRWIQGKLARELIDIINKFSHRPWNTIIREHKNGYVVGLWITTLRCLEIWDILKTTKKKKYSDPKNLKKFVTIIHFYVTRVRAKVDLRKPLTALESNIIESDVNFLLEEHRIASQLSNESGAWNMLYVKPELDVKEENKFHVCFECARRLKETFLTCDFCQLISFCDIYCLKENVDRLTSHPCNDLLIEKYIPPAEDLEFED